MLSAFVYITSIIGVSNTLMFVFILSRVFGTALVMLAVVGTWGLITIVFLSNQYVLAKIITRAKWKTLNEIQAQIKRLRGQEDIPSEKTLEHLGQLMDYHNRIKATRNSALDLRAGLNFLNSLLLPLLAFVLANLDRILALFSQSP